MSFNERYRREDFDSFVSITHRPTGFRFYQSGGRITVLKRREFDGLWSIFADFSTTELQIEHTVLTEAALRKAAITWLKDNAK